MNSVDREQFYCIEYIFSFDSGKPSLSYTILLDRTTLIAQPQSWSGEEPWTLLSYHRCSICPLDERKVRNCPIAFNISGLVESFGDMISYEEVDITVKVAERTYVKRVSVQHGLRSILGIYMASSGCPHMNILKPMVRFHLPFASMDETIFRHVATYLLSQYFEHTGGKRPDMDLENLKRRNDLVDQVNRGICRRIEGIADGDANRNALVLLNAIGQILKFDIEEKLNRLRYLFVSSGSEGTTGD